MKNRTDYPRILLSAYQCGPGIGSVSQIGWHWYSHLAQRVSTTLVTHIRNREVLNAAGTPLPDTEVIYIDTEWFAGPLYRIASRLFPKSQHAVFLISSLDYYIYDWVATKQLRARQAQGEHWDIVHVPTPVSPQAATRLHRLKRPVILGPWNGGLTSPPAFKTIMREDSSWLYPIRKLGRLMDTFIGSTRQAAMILTATQATLKTIPRRYRSRCVPMLENGVDLQLFSPAPWPQPPTVDNPLRIIYVGRLIPAKGVTMLLAAVEQAKRNFPLQVVIVGDGPLKQELKVETAQRNLQDIVTFTGSLTPLEVAAQIRAAHIFCLPSVRESGGAVLLEAMASARPVVTIAFGGPAEIVDDKVGVGIPPDGQIAVIEGLIAAFSDLVQYPDIWRKRGERGRKRVEAHYTWDVKVDTAVELYYKVLK